MRLKIMPQEETTRHHDTRFASGELLRLMYNAHKKYKRFLGQYFVTFRLSPDIIATDFYLIQPAGRS
jgi:uncharacterized membrane protein